MKSPILFAILTMLPVGGALATAPAKAELHNGMIKVASVISEHVNVMDIAGPWEVFADTSLQNDKGKDTAPYELYTVSASKTPLHSEGANHPGLTITPDYDFEHAPKPDIVVVPAQQGDPKLTAWLKQVHAQQITIMSVCTGAFQLGKAGLLDGKQATTHHWYFGNFAHEFPKVTLVKQARYVQSDPITFTAGGLTSGVDLALHLVTDRFGQDVAQQTANFMEYLGTGWKTNKGIPPMDLPVTHDDWTGQLQDQSQVVVHMTTYGASPTFTIDIPSWKVAGAAVTPGNDRNNVTFTFDAAGHPAVFTGTFNKQRDALSGKLVAGDNSSPLTLTDQKNAN